MSILVVGAGIFGASTAYHLAKVGHKVTIIDPILPGRATRAGAGIINPWSSPTTDTDWLALAFHGAAYYPALLPELAELGQTDIGYRRTGALNVPGSDAELATVEERVRSRVADQPVAGEITRISNAEARTLFPALGEGYDALHISGASRLDGDRLARALVNAAQRLGAEVRHETVEALTFTGQTVTGVRTNRETLSGDTVVLCAGVWGNGLLAPLGLALPVRIQRGQIFHLTLPGVDTSTWPVLLPMNNYYLLAFDDSRVVIGATREEGTGMDLRLTAGGVAEVLNAGLKVAPGLASATLTETRIGFRPMPSAVAPIYGAATGIDNLYLGNGLGHSGLTFGGFAGSELARIVGGEASLLPVKGYQPVAG